MIYINSNILSSTTTLFFQPIGFFIVMDELAPTIESCLELIKSWTPGWKALIVTTDMDAAEMLAIGNVFPDIAHFLCEFHVKQAWLRKFRSLGG